MSVVLFVLTPRTLGRLKQAGYVRCAECGVLFKEGMEIGGKAHRHAKRFDSDCLMKLGLIQENILKSSRQTKR